MMELNLSLSTSPFVHLLLGNYTTAIFTNKYSNNTYFFIQIYLQDVSSSQAGLQFTPT